jgi:hypothetical protein
MVMYQLRGHLPDNMREFVELYLDTLMSVTRIQIHETFHPGAIDTVYLRNEASGKWEIIFSATAKSMAEESNIHSVNGINVSFKS